NQTMAKALAAVKKLGVEEKFVQTMGLNLFPVYAQQRSSRIEPENQEPRIAGYRAENTIQVTLNDLGLVGKVIDAGIDAGLNRLEGVSFDLRNDTPQRQEALIHAIEEARAKAQVMAPALGVKLGDLREVFEEGSAAPPRPLNFRAERFAMAASDTPVQPGQMRIEASVTLRYEIIRRD
ncbi:MAG: DUF541 domain-containing protein, partial [Gammaproteobacteria bacterium]|nr:DUF541 domain-containing protein [Gammaproteobacteria bacterium]